MSRKHSNRKIRVKSTTILIITNGKRTEQGYLSLFKQLWRESSVHIKVDYMSGEPHQLIDKLRKPHGDTSQYDYVVIVVDEDGQNREEFLQKCRRLSNNRQEWIGIVSRPCFEVWLIAHYEAVRKYANQKDAQDHYRALLPNGWNVKAIPDDFPVEMVREATSRSRLPNTCLGRKNELPPSPGTGMPHLIHILDQL